MSTVPPARSTRQGAWAVIVVPSDRESTGIEPEGAGSVVFEPMDLESAGIESETRGLRDKGWSVNKLFRKEVGHVAEFLIAAIDERLSSLIF